MGRLRERREKILYSIFLWMVVFLWSQIGFLAIPEKNFAQEAEEVKESPTPLSEVDKMTKEIKEGFGYLFKAISVGNVQRPMDSTLNPNNDFLKIPRYTADLELRPDFSLNFRRLKINFKPRLDVKWEYWKEGPLKGDKDASLDTFVNEWLVSLRLIEESYISYGRENLQWGPSFLISPSNPFFRETGRSNPKREVPGMDFARLIWVPSSSWTISFIANVDKGRQEFLLDDFEPTYAFKLDYTTYRKYASLIVSYQENNRASLGGFAGWTVSDAVLVYARVDPIKRDQCLISGIESRITFWDSDGSC